MGSVFNITPLTTGFDNDVPAATSSDPNVVDELSNGPTPGGEYRAFAVGRATLTIPRQSCSFTTPPCMKPWFVDLDITQ